MRVNVLVIDGQGGGLGRSVIEQLKSRFPALSVTAVGTNSTATAAMLKAGADAGATGENPVVYCSARADVIIGPVGILAANAFLGEITPAMARAVGESPAWKLLLPFARCSIFVAGTQDASPAECVRQVTERVAQLLDAQAKSRPEKG